MERFKISFVSILTLFVFLWAILGMNYIQAKNTEADSLDRANNYYKKKMYEEALVLLNAFIKENKNKKVQLPRVAQAYKLKAKIYNAWGVKSKKEENLKKMYEILKMDVEEKEPVKKKPESKKKEVKKKTKPAKKIVLKPAKKKKIKKKFPWWMVIAGVAVVGTIVAIALLIKKSDEGDNGGTADDDECIIDESNYTQVFSSNFDDGTLQGWGVRDNSDISSKQAHSGSYSLMVRDSVIGGNFAECYRIFNEVSIGVTEFWLYLPSSNTRGINMKLVDKPTYRINPGNRFVIDIASDGTIQYKSQSGWQTLSSTLVRYDTWEKIVIKWNCTLNEFELCLNGVFLGKGTHGSTGGNIQQIIFQSKCQNCTGIFGYFDDIRALRHN